MNDKQQLAAMGDEIRQHIKSEADKDKHPATMRVYQSDIPALTGVDVGKPTMSISDLVNGDAQPLCMAKRIEVLEAVLAEAREMMENQPRGFSGMIKRIDAALSGKLPELRITKPARIGGVVFQPGIKASLVIEAAYRAAEHHESNPAAFQELQAAMLAATPKPEAK